MGLEANRDELHKKVDLVCADGLYRDRGYPYGRLPAPRDGRDNLDFWCHQEYESYRIDHGGNLGDATDVFDGEQFTAFTPHTNPASRGEVWIQGIRRRGTDRVADVQVPQWSGSILQDTIWDGVVNVVGDIVVEGGVTLTIRSGTVVRFAPTDALDRGMDPHRCEIDLLGALHITSGQAPVCFTMGGQGTWVGIRVHEGGHVECTDADFRVEDCLHPLGMFWSEQPDAGGLTLLGCLVEDNQRGCNDDGILDPGEKVRLQLIIDNPTPITFRKLDVVLWTSDPLVRLPSRRSHRNIEPGRRTARSAGFLTVASECPDGHCIGLNIELQSGLRTWTYTWSLTVGDPMKNRPATDIGAATDRSSIPLSFVLKPNVPNPFNAHTVIGFDLPQASDLRLTIFNAAGQMIRQWEGHWAAGEHHLAWNGDDENGLPVASGVYLYSLRTEGFVDTQSMTLIR
jgi:hypothetical protein